MQCEPGACTVQLERQRYVTQLLREAIGTAVEQLTGGKRAEEAGVRAGVAAPDPVGEAFRELQTELDQRRQLLQAYEFMVEVSRGWVQRTPRLWHSPNLTRGVRWQPLVSWGHEHAMGSDPLRDSDIGHEIRCGRLQLAQLGHLETDSTSAGSLCDRYWRVHNASGGAPGHARSEGDSTVPSVDTGAGAGAGAGAAARTGSNGNEGHGTVPPSDTADHADEDSARSEGDVGFPQPLRLPFVEFLLCFQPCQSRASRCGAQQPVLTMLPPPAHTFHVVERPHAQRDESTDPGGGVCSPAKPGVTASALAVGAIPVPDSVA